MGYFDVANSPLLYVLVAAGVLYIVGLSAVFLRKSWRRCLELGISKEKLSAVARSSAAFTPPSVSSVSHHHAAHPYHCVGCPPSSHFPAHSRQWAGKDFQKLYAPCSAQVPVPQLDDRQGGRHRY